MMMLLTLHTVEVAVSVAGAGVLQCALAVHPLQANVELDHLGAVIFGRVGRIDDRAWHVDGHAADRVNGGPEALEVDQPEMIDGTPKFFSIVWRSSPMPPPGSLNCSP